MRAARPTLDAILAMSSLDRLGLGRAIAHELGASWTASDALVGAGGMIELVHASGHAFVVIGSTRFARGLRASEREALITAMIGPRDEGDDVERDPDAERAFVATQIPRGVMPTELVEVPAFLIGREPLSVMRAAALGGPPLQDLGYPEASGDASEWRAFVHALPDGLRQPTEEEWELVARGGGERSWIVPMPPNGFPGLWPPEAIFAHENALGVRSLAVAEVFANGQRRGVGDGRGNWGGSTGNAELHAAARWGDAFGGSRLARSL